MAKPKKEAKYEGQIGRQGEGYSKQPDYTVPEFEFPELSGRDNFAGVTDIKAETKKGEPFGEAAMFNYLPPGQDITEQRHSDIRELKMKSLVNPQGYFPFGS